MVRKFFLIVFIAFIISSLSGCGGKNIEETNSPPEELYEEALYELNDEGLFGFLFSTNYDSVLYKLRTIKLKYPYSPYATLAEVRIADAYYQKGEYEQASVEYDEFIKRHPAHEEVPHAYYRSGLSYYNRMRPHDRNQSYTKEALRWFESLLEKYPDSPLVEDAGRMRDTCREKLARHELYVGKFYMKRDKYKAAAERFRTVALDYDGTKPFEEALFLLGKSYYSMGEGEQAKGVLQKLIEEFPQSKYAEKSSELITKIGNGERPGTGGIWRSIINFFPGIVPGKDKEPSKG